MRFLALAFVALPLVLSAAACSRSNLSGAPPSEEGGGGAGGGTTTTTSSTTTTTTTVIPGSCGDGVVQEPEECDDGNSSPQDACLPGCTLAFCGDGVVHVGFEQCDDGNASPSDDCVFCAVAFCGDGFVRVGFEECDDGNLDDGDGCTTQCTFTSSACGDGVIDPGEECDDGNASSQDACLATCQKAFCGDGFTFAGVEQCDDGNGSNQDACVQGCVSAVCGDGFTFAGVEQCDDGNLSNGDGCSSTCQLPVCGDGVKDPGEACDLGAMNADRPAFLLSWQMQSSPVLPVASASDAAIFYAYFSASGHTGFEQVDTSLMFLHANTTTQALSLFVEHGIDFTTTGQSQAMSQVIMDLTGLPAAAVVALSDDTPAEFFKSSATSVHGDWSFQQNTDGGVVSGLPFPGAWTIGIQTTFTGAVTAWKYQNGGSAPAPVPLTGTTATLQAFDTPSPCRTSCTVPACGDGILDGGEVCDDGNVASGDGCAADCKAF